MAENPLKKRLKRGYTIEDIHYLCPQNLGIDAGAESNDSDILNSDTQEYLIPI